MSTTMHDERWTLDSKCHGKRIPLLDTKGYTKEPWFLIPLSVESCETAQKAFTFSGTLRQAIKHRGTAWQDGLSNYSHTTILNMKSTAWTKMSWVLNSYQRKHGTYKCNRSGKRPFWVAEKHVLSNWCTSPIWICEHEETSSWERPSIKPGWTKWKESRSIYKDMQWNSFRVILTWTQKSTKGNRQRHVKSHGWKSSKWRQYENGE